MHTHKSAAKYLSPGEHLVGGRKIEKVDHLQEPGCVWLTMTNGTVIRLCRGERVELEN